MCERLPWAEWGEARKGMAELEGLPVGVLAHFSRRRAEIVAWLEAEQRSGRQSAEKAALATREPKSGPVALAPWRERVRAEAAEHGFGRADLAILTRQANQQSKQRSGARPRTPAPDDGTPCGRAVRGHGSCTGCSSVNPSGLGSCPAGPAEGRRGNTAAFAWKQASDNSRTRRAEVVQLSSLRHSAETLAVRAKEQ